MSKKNLPGAALLAGAGLALTSLIAASPAGAVGAGVMGHVALPVKKLTTSVHLKPIGIRRMLQARGFYNIVFLDRQLPVYRVRACRNGKNFRIRLNRWGDVMRIVRRGWCDGRHFHGGPRVGLSFPEIRHKLRNRGYYRIRFTDRRLPGYRARACKHGKRFVLWLNRWGRIMDRDRRGWCAIPYYYRKHSRYDDDDRYERDYRGPYIRYEGPGFSISLRKGYRY